MLLRFWELRGGAARGECIRPGERGEGHSQGGSSDQFNLTSPGVLGYARITENRGDSSLKQFGGTLFGGNNRLRGVAGDEDAAAVLTGNLST